jgi:hypothetical protein
VCVFTRAPPSSHSPRHSQRQSATRRQQSRGAKIARAGPAAAPAPARRGRIFFAGSTGGGARGGFRGGSRAVVAGGARGGFRGGARGRPAAAGGARRADPKDFIVTITPGKGAGKAAGKAAPSPAKGKRVLNAGSSLADMAASGLNVAAMVHVGNLVETVTKEDLLELFSTVGHVSHVELRKGSGTVTMANAADANSAITQYNGIALDGKPMLVAHHR